MNKWFEDKSSQIDHPRIVSFGIEMETRYSRAMEMIEMLEFSYLAACENLNNFVSIVFYDSKADICTFVLSDHLVKYSKQDDTLLRIAKKTISQFIWNDLVYHGRGFEDE